MEYTPKHIREKIHEAQEENPKELDLSCGWRTEYERLTQFPAEVLEWEQLEKLTLKGHLFTSIPNSITHLQNLTSLDLSDNQLTKIPDSISRLQSLEQLHLVNNKLSAIPDCITLLKNLTTLDLGNNLITAIPESIIKLRNLMYFGLWANHLTCFPEPITQLHNLTKLILGANQINSISDSIIQLQKLVDLYLYDCNFTFIPEAIYQLPSLENLILGNGYLSTGGVNQIKEISAQILQLKKLEHLDLKDNPIEIPPPEIVDKGTKAIMNYFRQLEAEGKDYLYEAKLLIVGEGGAGKTTLAKKIENYNYDLRKDEKTTEGINVIQWSYPMGNKRSFRVNIWDFGGQEIYHATHQFFLTKRSLYALVADTRREDTDFYYWLNIVELLSGNSPLLIIKNEKQDRLREINERQLRGQFTNLKETLATNLATNRGLPEILTKIKHYISTLSHVGTLLPKTWVKVREALENDPHNYISFTEYLEICQQNGFTHLKDKLQLIGYLHDLGVCLHFQEDPLLKKSIIGRFSKCFSYYSGQDGRRVATGIKTHLLWAYGFAEGEGAEELLLRQAECDSDARESASLVEMADCFAANEGLWWKI